MWTLPRDSERLFESQTAVPTSVAVDRAARPKVWRGRVNFSAPLRTAGLLLSGDLHRSRGSRSAFRQVQRSPDDGGEAAGKRTGQCGHSNKHSYIHRQTRRPSIVDGPRSGKRTLQWSFTPSRLVARRLLGEHRNLQLRLGPSRFFYKYLLGRLCAPPGPRTAPTCCPRSVSSAQSRSRATRPISARVYTQEY